MKLLITGGAGFIGLNFIKYWLANYPDDEIVNLDKLTYAANKAEARKLENDHENYKLVVGDICDTSLVDQLTKDADTIVHFAAESHVDRSIEDSSPFIKTNVLGTQILLDAALHNNIDRFHHISTDEVFGQLELDSKDKFSESTPYDPRSPYSASKAAADHLVRAYYYTHNLPVTITNCSNNYGPYQNPEKFIPNAITNILNGGKIKIYGDGKYVRDWLYVEDHCRAIDMVLKKGKVGETYVVGGLEDDYSNLEIAKMILEILGKDESYIEFVTDRKGHDRRYAVDFSKIKNDLGWGPEKNLKEGLKKTVEWYENNN